MGAVLSPCTYCLRLGHTPELCPKKAADVRGETTRCLQDSARTGVAREVCGYGGYKALHHRLAAADAQFTVDSKT
eukprot:3505631-Alexandrium_andersonii.AAC.1